MQLQSNIKPLTQIKPIGKTLLTLGIDSDFSLSSDDSQAVISQVQIAKNQHSLTDIMHASTQLSPKLKHTIELLHKMHQRSDKLLVYTQKIEKKLIKIQQTSIDNFSKTKQQ